MANWVTFANVTQLNTPDLDTNFGILAAKVVYPCSISGTNTIALTTALSDPAVTAYTSDAPIFAFVAAANSTGAITINVNGIGAKNLYKQNGAIAAGSGDLTAGNVYYIAYNSTLNSAAGGFVLISNAGSGLGAVTVQTFLSGGSSGTYTPTAGTVRAFVQMVGGGGGGGAEATNSGGNGGNTTFGSGGAQWIAGGGTGGTHGTSAGGAAGGTNTTGVSNGTVVKNFPGGAGGGSSGTVAGIGGNSMLGGGGPAPNQNGTNAGQNGVANSGGGASGGVISGTGGGAGGGAGGYLEFWLQNPTAQAYAVGGGGTNGAAGGAAGGTGGTGGIWVTEYPF